MFPGTTTGGFAVDLQITTAGGLSVSANAGMCQIGRDSNGPYYAGLTAATSVTHGTANASNPRVDIVVLRTRDPGVDSSVTESSRLTIIPGTAAAVPSAPTSSLTSGDIVLAYVTVRAGSTSIAGSDIEDRRQFVAARGGIAPQSASDSKGGSYRGQYKDDGTALIRWSGSSWEPVATPAVWSTWSAPLNTSGGTVSIGSSGSYACRFLRTGKRGDLSYTWTTGGTGINVRSGAITSLLPSGWVSRALGETHMTATVYTAAQGSVAQFLMQGDCVVLPNDNVMYFRFPFNGNTSLMGPFVGATSSGGVGSGSPVVPNGYWGNPGPILAVSGVIELQ